MHPVGESAALAECVITGRATENSGVPVSPVCDPERVTWESNDPGSIIAAAMSSPLQWELMFRFNQALELTDGLRSLCDVVVATADREEYTNPATRADQAACARGIPEERRAQLRAWVDAIVDGMNSGFDDLVVDETAVAGLTGAEVMADPFGTITKLVDFSRIVEKYVVAAKDPPTDKMDESAYLLTYLRYRGSSPWAPTVLRALFVTAVSSVEPIVSRFVQLVLQHQDPTRFPSLASEELDEAARKLCFGPPSKWRTALVDELGIAAAGRAVDWPALEALWEDRNVLIHRGGLVDQRHSNKTGTEVGTVVLPTAERVREVADVVAGIRYGLSVAVWDYLSPGAGAFMVSQDAILVIDFLRSERWALADALARVEMSFATDEVTVATARVNHWLAVQQGTDLEATRTELEAWDLTNLPARFAMAKSILLGEDEKALEQLRHLREAGEVTAAEVMEWPIFDRLRLRRVDLAS
jgi:hypothetical protein